MAEKAVVAVLLLLQTRRVGRVTVCCLGTVQYCTVSCCARMQIGDEPPSHFGPAAHLAET